MKVREPSLGVVVARGGGVQEVLATSWSLVDFFVKSAEGSRGEGEGAVGEESLYPGGGGGWGCKGAQLCCSHRGSSEVAAQTVGLLPPR